MMQSLDISVIGWLLGATLQMSTPLVLTALGGMFSERSGVVNIGLEGMMLIGAFTSVAIAYTVGNPWLGLLGAVVGGGLLAAIHAIVSVSFKGNQIVSGAGIILIGSGISTIGTIMVWGNPGYSAPLSSDKQIPNVEIPIIQDIPIIGPAFGSQSPVVYLMFVIVILSWYVLYRTPFGLRVRAAGEDPSTLDAAGVNVDRTRILSVVISGCLAGLGGAYLSLGYTKAFGQGMT
ncbi:MAG: ABC transporter permease, partial [Candidatus Thorarchaeota archaeon]|nr:ABC transporter permease [Candidatus Thorarchaeota archaeon]